MRLLKYLSLFFILNGTVAAAQTQASIDTLFSLPDSVRVFTIDNFYELILENHPVAKQARLLPEVAQQEIRLARGNFDPKLEADFIAKQYQNKEYYNEFYAHLNLRHRICLMSSLALDQLRETKYLRDVQ